MITDAPAWVFEELDKWMRTFFWAGKDQVSGGNCMVAWNAVCKPTCFGGLGIKNLKLQGLALRVRWEWLKRTNPERPWQGMRMSEDEDARAVFDSMVKIEVGEGTKVLFWRDRWIHGFAVTDIAPMIHALVDTRTRIKRMVSEGLENGRWLHDINGELNFVGHLQLVHLNLAINTVQRDPSNPDCFSWPADPSGLYSAKSTYQKLCLGDERAPYASCIWKSWALLKCKIFIWLAVQHRIWTSDRRAKHGLQDRPSACYTCLQDEDNAEHILVQCGYAREVWHTCFQDLALNTRASVVDDTFLDWWIETR
uniref:Reverse transcriptase zinc-binding domain-containing protein n=1 Tax=Triticum urartu TaxID=4572 RepID=A0A8R7RED1_TRIUA